jgi:hypothetical protein
MASVLPNNFGERASKIGEWLLDYEASNDDDEKDDLLRRTLVYCCDLLKSINLQELEREIGEVFTNADRQVPGWRQKIIGDVDHFKFFMENVEDKILKATGVSECARSRIKHELFKVRVFAERQGANPGSAEIIGAIANLRDEVCKLKDEQIEKADEKRRKEEQAKRHSKIVQSLGVLAILADGTVTVASVGGSIAAAAASITLGATSLKLPGSK